MTTVQSSAISHPLFKPYGKWAKWEPYDPNHRPNVTENNIEVCHPSPPNRTPSPTPFDDEYSIMTGRQDPVASVKAEAVHKENLQGRDNLLRTQEIKQHKRSNGISSKPLRPPMEIYSPRNNLKKNSPKLGVSSNNSEEIVTSQQLSPKELLSKNGGTKVHFVDSPSPKKSSPPPPSSAGPPPELKSALKRSKSFTADEGRGMETLGFDREAFPLEYQGLIRRAVLDPNSLSCQKLMELVRLICSKAIESVQYSSPAAQLCFSIIEKEHDHTFLESLQNCCREWFNERDKLLRAPFPGTSRRWTAYVSFLARLFSHVKSQHGGQAPHPNSPMAHLALTLQTLLYECANIILKPPSLGCEGEVEILRQMLTSVGQQLESDCSQRMQQLVVHLRDAFLHPSLSAPTRKALLEVIELHASGWALDLPQTLYYFPYTRL